jgi:hypothetical protein
MNSTDGEAAATSAPSAPRSDEANEHGSPRYRIRHDPQLAVHAASAADVQDALTTRGINVDQLDRSIETTLDLVLFTLAGWDLRRYAARQRGPAGSYVNEVRLLEARAGRRFTDLELLMYELRTELARTLGHVPAMGKNRDVVAIEPQHKGGGVTGDPQHKGGGVEGSPQHKGGGGGFVPIPDVGPVDPIPASRDPHAASEHGYAHHWAPIPTTGPGSGVIVGVVDTAVVRGDHPELTATFVTQPARDDLHPPKSPPPVIAGHGTFVVGLIRAGAPGARVVVSPALLADDGDGTSWDVALALAAFLKPEGQLHADVDIVNLSLGVVTEDDEPPFVLRQALAKLAEARPGLLVVASAGNRASLPDPPAAVWPAAQTGVVAVGATTEYGSHFSPRKLWVDATAPGVDVVSLYLSGEVDSDDGEAGPFDEGIARWSGTSFSSATVAGAIAARMTHRSDGTARPSPIAAAAALRELFAESGSPVSRYVHIPT